MRSLYFLKACFVLFCQFGFLTIFALLFTSNISGTQAETLTGKPWTVSKNFSHGKKAREGISGAACAGTVEIKNWCLVVNDEKNYAQFFKRQDDQKTITPTKTIRLLPKTASDGTPYDELDAEGAAYDNGFVYIIGSHAKSRKACEFQASRYHLVRFPVDAKTGKPQFKKYGRKVAPEVARSDALRKMIAQAPYVGGTAATACLDKNGTNIEGVAVASDSLFVGFRSPSQNGTAFIMQVALDPLFVDGTADIKPKVHSVQLGANQGVRDLAKVDNGFLILAGASLSKDEESTPADIYFWNPAKNTTQKLVTLPKAQGTKLETLLVLDPSDAKSDQKEADSAYRVLVFYEGLANGQPTEFLVPRLTARF